MSSVLATGWLVMFGVVEPPINGKPAGRTEGDVSICMVRGKETYFRAGKSKSSSFPEKHNGLGFISL